MRVEMKKSIEKFGAETEKVFRKQNKKQREKRPLIRKLEDWTTTSNVCLKGFWERETDKTEGCKNYEDEILLTGEYYMSKILEEKKLCHKEWKSICGERYLDADKR